MVCPWLSRRLTSRESHAVGYVDGPHHSLTERQHFADEMQQVCLVVDHLPGQQHLAIVVQDNGVVVGLADIGSRPVPGHGSASRSTYFVHPDDPSSMVLLSDTRGPAAPHQWSSRRAAPGGQVSQEPLKAPTPKPYPGPLDPPDRTTAHPTHHQRRTTPRIIDNRRGKSYRTRRPEAPSRSHENGNGGRSRGPTAWCRGCVTRPRTPSPGPRCPAWTSCTSPGPSGPPSPCPGR